MKKIHPDNFEQECTTVWSFARRGNWATHNSSRDLSVLKSESIDFILNHPPYADIIKYINKQIDGDLSNIHDLDKFCDEMEKVAYEFYRVLKKDIIKCQHNCKAMGARVEHPLVIFQKIHHFDF